VRFLSLVALALVAGCAARFEVVPGAGRPFDAVIVPGCPSEDDGSLSPCQMSRAVWAAILWRRGVAAAFITSGAAVHSPYVEAEALAQAMAALGVPAERIWIEPNALHTDENMYYSLQIARALGLHRLAVASQHGHAAWGCQMLSDWGQPCGALSLDLPAVAAEHARPRLQALRTPPAQPWPTLAMREQALLEKSGRRRPPSFLLYPYIAYLRLDGQRWIPYAPARPPLVTWARLRSSFSATR
jgi:DUF218 domain-containing protein